jgi:hypothetical protein
LSEIRRDEWAGGKVPTIFAIIGSDIESANDLAVQFTIRHPEVDGRLVPTIIRRRKIADKKDAYIVVSKRGGTETVVSKSCMAGILELSDDILLPTAEDMLDVLYEFPAKVVVVDPVGLLEIDQLLGVEHMAALDAQPQFHGVFDPFLLSWRHRRTLLASKGPAYVARLDRVFRRMRPFMFEGDPVGEFLMNGANICSQLIVSLTPGLPAALRLNDREFASDFERKFDTIDAFITAAENGDLRVVEMDRANPVVMAGIAKFQSIRQVFFSRVGLDWPSDEVDKFINGMRFCNVIISSKVAYHAAANALSLSGMLGDISYLCEVDGEIRNPNEAAKSIAHEVTHGSMRHDLLHVITAPTREEEAATAIVAEPIATDQAEFAGEPIETPAVETPDVNETEFVDSPEASAGIRSGGDYPSQLGFAPATPPRIGGVMPDGLGGSRGAPTPADPPPGGDDSSQIEVDDQPVTPRSSDATPGTARDDVSNRLRLLARTVGLVSPVLHRSLAVDGKACEAGWVMEHLLGEEDVRPRVDKYSIHYRATPRPLPPREGWR